MSKNRKRNGGMKRAYLKKTTYTRDTNPDSTMRASIGLNRDINPITAVPHRARLWLNKNKHTPTMTEPMAARTESWHLHIKEDKKEWVQTLIDTPFCKIKMFFNGFTDKAVYRFTKVDHLSGVKRESFTLTKDKALRIKESGLKGIPWK